MKIDDANEHVYDYDCVYRLTYVDYNDGNDMSFIYDALGNRHRTINGGTIAYQTNGLNQYTAVAGTAYTYDDNGNLAFDGQFRYYYDRENHLLDVNDANDAPVASYAYDYLGRRISRTIYGTPDVTIRYAYDGDRILAEYDGAGTLLRKFVYGPGIDEPICLIDAADANALYYYHCDGLGSVVALCDVNSVPMERYTYGVFGRPTIRNAAGVVIEQSAFSNPYLFTGRAYDAETALYYYRSRYYDYHTSRFVQPDPIGYADGLNVYTYCGNNPLVHVDPFGLAADDERAKRQEQYNAYIERAEQAMRENIASLEQLHENIKWTDDYYYKVLLVDTAVSAASWTRSAAGLARGVTNMRSATQSLSTPLQQIAFGPGKDLVRDALGQRQVLRSVADMAGDVALNAVVVAPMTQVIPAVSDVEVSIAGARRKLTSGYQKQAEQLMANIRALSNGISEARKRCKE